VTKVVLLPEAEEDLAEAALFLEQRVTGLGDGLVMEVERSLVRLGRNPYVGPDVGDGARKLQMGRFPYGLIYRVEAERVLVLAVAHSRRRPGYWRNRG
jgi:plasmid stabilization system protein ParE